MSRVTRRDERCFRKRRAGAGEHPNFKTPPKSKFSKSGVFETLPCDLAGACFETGATPWVTVGDTILAAQMHSLNNIL